MLLAVGIGVAVMLRNDFQVLANLRGATEAFYFSSAGLEWGKREIAQATSFPPVPANQSKYFSSGEFAVSFLSSTAVGPLEARVVVRSSGTSRGAQHILQAQLTKAYDLTDAALALRGNGAGVSFSAATLFISGADHDPTTGNPIPGARPRSSVSTDEIVHGLVLEALGDPPRQDILYNDPDTPAVATSGYLSAGFVTELANGLCASAPATLHSIPSTGGLTVENQIWGDPASPQLHCIEGSSASGDAATFTGNFAGAGVLVIRNADLILTGTFQWEGLIIVTGTDVSLKTTGSSNKDLLGAAIVSETGIPGAGRAVLDMEGTIRLMFSRKALDRAVPLIPTVILNSAYESLPSVISQNYWRAVTP
ncbi:MAG TPA: hypothetical protein VGB09_01855 [Candidatus Binatia bacterium]